MRKQYKIKYKATKEHRVKWVNTRLPGLAQYLPNFNGQLGDAKWFLDKAITPPVDYFTRLTVYAVAT